MKHFKILILCLVIGISTKAQGPTEQKVGTLQMAKPTITWNGWKAFGKNGDLAFYWRAGSDTLMINEPLQIHFIQVGKNIYQLVTHETTIDKVEPKGFFGASDIQWNNSGSWYGAADTLSTLLIDITHYTPIHLPVSK